MHKYKFRSLAASHLVILLYEAILVYILSSLFISE